jgi:hypothetical protein
VHIGQQERVADKMAVAGKKCGEVLDLSYTPVIKELYQ